MRFIILAPILCLFAVVAAYPFQQVRSPEEPTGPLIQREVGLDIHRRGMKGFLQKIFFSKPASLPPLKVKWKRDAGALAATVGAKKEIAEKIALKRTKAYRKKHLRNRDHAEISMHYNASNGWWSARIIYTGIHIHSASMFFGDILNT